MLRPNEEMSVLQAPSNLLGKFLDVPRKPYWETFSIDDDRQRCSRPLYRAGRCGESLALPIPVIKKGTFQKL